MKKQSKVGLMFIGLACALIALVCSSLGESAALLVGKAIWYLPYVSFVVGVRLLVVSR